MGRNRSAARRNDNDHPAIWVGYGKLVKLFRDRAGLTQPALADAMGYSYDLVASVEQGRRPAKAEFTAGAETALGLDGELATLQDEVDRAKLPAFFQDFAAIEMEAVSFSWYGSHVIPGLLQTEEYARALLGTHCPPLDEETVEHRVEARLKRQAILTRKPVVEVSFVIDEHVLRCPVGGAAIMRRQLDHVLECMELRNVHIQVMPTSNAAHPGLNGPMVLIETMDHRQVGYVESQDIGVVVSDPDTVSAFALGYGKLRSLALNVDDSARFIKRMAGETWEPGTQTGTPTP